MGFWKSMGKSTCWARSGPMCGSSWTVTNFVLSQLYSLPQHAFLGGMLTHHYWREKGLITENYSLAPRSGTALLKTGLVTIWRHHMFQNMNRCSVRRVAHQSKALREGLVGKRFPFGLMPFCSNGRSRSDALNSLLYSSSLNAAGFRTFNAAVCQFLPVCAVVRRFFFCMYSLSFSRALVSAINSMYVIYMYFWVYEELPSLHAPLCINSIPTIYYLQMY